MRNKVSQEADRLCFLLVFTGVLSVLTYGLIV
jgi:hypothetical protein